MKELKGNWMNEDGTVGNAGVLVVDNGMDAETGEKLIAKKYKESWGEFVEVTTIGGAWVFSPAGGECERCGLAVIEA